MEELKRFVSMNLQLLAEDIEDIETDDTDNIEDSEKKDEQVDPRLAPKYSIEDLNAIIKKEKSKWERKQQRKEEETQLSPEEQKKLELAEKERELTKRELKITAQTELAKRNIPTDLLDFLDYTDEDACEESIDRLEKAFGKALEGVVAQKLKEQAPVKKGGELTKKNDLQEQIRAGLRKKF